MLGSRKHPRYSRVWYAMALDCELHVLMTMMTGCCAKQLDTRHTIEESNIDRCIADLVCNFSLYTWICRSCTL